MESVIVLNRDYQFWDEVDFKRAITWFFQDKIQIIKYHPTREIRSVSIKIKMPLIVRLLTFVGFRPKREIIPFSSEAVYYRDKNICQYWHYDNMGNKFQYTCTSEDRTVDHILPLSKGGKNDFENCVCACKNCNEVIKKNRLPEEVGLKLIRKPVIPKRDIHSFVMKIPVFKRKQLAYQIYFKEVLGVM